MLRGGKGFTLPTPKTAKRRTQGLFKPTFPRLRKVPLDKNPNVTFTDVTAQSQATLSANTGYSSQLRLNSSSVPGSIINTFNSTGTGLEGSIRFIELCFSFYLWGLALLDKKWAVGSHIP